MDIHFMVAALNVFAWVILFGSFSVFVWRMIKTRRIRFFVLLFLLWPASQIIILYSLDHDPITTFWLVGIVSSLAANFSLLGYTISQENKIELEKGIKEMQHFLELEQAHYCQVEQRMKELAIIRNDFRSRLGTVATLVRLGEDDSARHMISNLSEKINRTKENPYCDIPIINAVLTEKAGECEAADIQLIIDLDLPNHIDIPQMHLCSIFSNLMDNAIAACRNIANGTGAANDTNPSQKTATRPVIRLSSLAEGDYLFIKTVNPAIEPAMNASPKRGYGFRILSELSSRYDGKYQTEYNSGCFTAIVSLLAVHEGEVAE